MKLSISRNILSFIRNHFRGESQKLQSDFTLLLLRFWGIFYNEWYESYKNFNYLICHEFNVFIIDIMPYLIEFIEKILNYKLI